MYDMYGKEGLFASAGGPGASGGGGWAQQGGFPGGAPGFFGGSNTGPGGSTFFSFSDGGAGGEGGGANFDGFTDPRKLFEELFSGGAGGGGSNSFGSLFGSPSFDDLPGMHGMGGSRGGAGRRRKGGGGQWGANGQRRGRSSARHSGPPIEKEFSCSLRELYEGCEKKMKVGCLTILYWRGREGVEGELRRPEVFSGN